ncbi:MAG TPA: hypothetical protein IAC31_06520 [Candidatus Faecousia intestinigallinarum]|nr:hypothetical protein [Candidatus Faecousia intestinigallinarum]
MAFREHWRGAGAGAKAAGVNWKIAFIDIFAPIKAGAFQSVPGIFPIFSGFSGVKIWKKPGKWLRGRGSWCIMKANFRALRPTYEGVGYHVSGDD